MPIYEQFNPGLVTRDATPEIAARGRSYFFSGHATVVAIARYRSVVSVRGSEPQPYSVTLSWDKTAVDSQCTCAFVDGDQRVICKHKVAAALATEHYLRLHPRVTWQSVLDDAVHLPKKAVGKPSKVVLVFSLQSRYGAWGAYVYALNANLFDSTALENNEQINRTINLGQLSTRAKHSKSAVEDQRIANNNPSVLLAANLCWSFQQSSIYAWNSDKGLSRAVPFFRDVPLFHGTEDNPLKGAVKIDDSPARLEIELKTADDGIHVLPTLVSDNRRILVTDASKVRFISTAPGWALIGDKVQPVEGDLEQINSLLRVADLVIPPDEIAEFNSNYLVPLAERLPISGEGINWTEIDTTPIPLLYLRQNEDREPIAELRYRYGDEITIKPNAADQETSVVHVSKDQLFVRVKRSLEIEKEAETLIVRHGLRKAATRGEYTFKQTTDIVGFLIHDIPKLVAAGFEIYGEEDIINAKINRLRPRLSMQVASGIDWFDVNMTVKFGDADAPIKAIRHAFKKKEKFIKLSDGSIAALPEDWIKKYSYLFAIGEDTEDGDGLRLKRHHAVLLGDMLEDADEHLADAQFELALDRLKSFESIQQRTLPEGLNAELRPYQKHGYDWLHFLREYGTGGCIADDMGLGKTIQVLAFLLSMSKQYKENTNRASLVVVPRSLIFNWQREATKFTPSLRILVHADQLREKTSESFGDYDIVLTTYGILLRDIELLKEYQFRCAVLDESQAIKNPVALSSKASRLIRADQRLTLTGTPVENSTQDLWSQFAFLNPGLLGSLDQFRNQFGAAIDRSQDADRAMSLRRLVHPFILRRTKEQVAPELPPRTERIVYTEMAPAERKFYDQTKTYYQNIILGMFEKEGIAKSRMKVLEGLLRLRQICNHPRLVDTSYDGPASKFGDLIETLIELRSEGHKALIFSQFVQMLKLVQKELDQIGMPYEFLTGQTRDRQERVDSFQNNPEIPFFLISLKAGGVGLNLTAADYVIHIDPWWNPAVEMQATDRTHRIGQDKPVFIYKLIAKDTVEDKILQLQDRKRDVVKQVISNESGFFKSLTRSDIEGLFV